MGVILLLLLSPLRIFHDKPLHNLIRSLTGGSQAFVGAPNVVDDAGFGGEDVEVAGFVFARGKEVFVDDADVFGASR